MPYKFARKKAQKNKLALSVLAFIVIILILGQVLNLFKILSNPWKENSALSRNYLLDGTFNTNIVMRNKYVSVLSFNPLAKSATLLVLPNQTYLQVAHGFGQWELRSIYDLGQSSVLGGENLLTDSLSLNLGLFIDGYIEFGDNMKDKEPGKLLEYLQKGPFNIFDTLSKVKTDLTIWQLIKLKTALSSVRFDKIKIIDFAKNNTLDPIQLPDGTSVLSMDLTRVDSVLSGLVDPKIRSEALTISVYNATSHISLAQRAARLITNIGGNVIITGNVNFQSDKTYVFGDQAVASSVTLKRLIQVFNSDKIFPSGFDSASSRAQINIILGEDYYRKLF